MTKENTNTSGAYQAGNALLGSDERFRIISELTASFAYAERIEPDGSIVLEWASDTVKQLTGYTADEIHSLGLHSIILSDDCAAVSDYVKRIISGQSGISENRIVTKGGEVRWLRFCTRPIRDEAQGRVVRIHGAAQDVTEQKLIEEELRRKEQDLTDFIENAAVGLHWVGPDGTIIWANQAELDLLGYTREEYVGHHIAEFHADGHVIDDILRRLANKETLHSYPASLKRKDGTIRHVLISSNVRWDGEQFVHTRCFTRDVTEIKKAETERSLLASIVESSDDAILSKNLDGIILSWNTGAERLYDYSAEEVIGQPVSILMPPERAADFPSIMERLQRGEKVDHYETERIRKDGQRLYVSLTVSPILDASGKIIGASAIARDITERKRAAEALRTIAERLNLAFAAADLGDWSWDASTDLVTFSERAAEIFGIPPGPHMTWTRMQGLLHANDRDPARQQVERAVAEGGRYDIEYRVNREDGTQVWVAALGRAQYDAANQAQGMYGVVQDITERKQAEEALREEREIVESINRIGVMLSAELDQEKLVQSVTDAATDLTGAHFGSFFYNVFNEQGGAYMLYTLSGVPREAFSHFPMPRATDLFGPTFRGEGTVLITDVKRDPRYGKNSPYYGMPTGHLPVTSYLAIPVVSRSGEVIGGLFFGHPEPGVFTERDARIVEGLAAQTAIAMDNARLYQRAQQSVAEREELLNREQQAREEAETASRAKDEFLSMLSHELRTPLNALMGWTRMLQTGNLDEEMMSRAIETITRNVQLQARLIEDMLDVSRIISGKLRLDAQPTDPTVVVNAAVDTLRPAADAKNIRLQVVMDFGAGLVLGDPGRLQQVIWNLLSNAIKFTPKGGKVQVQLERVNSHIEITVSDTGPGIDEGFLPHVFERFRQADSTSTRVHGGLGLGLSIVRHLVELHGGTVEAGNRADRQGAILTVRLPLMVVRKPTGSLGIEAERVHPTASGNLPFDCPPALDGLRILAVDDEADARELLAAVLERCGAEVKTCASASEALEALEQYKPDILVSDIGMPGEDGYALIEKVRAWEEGRGRQIPAVALTAYARAEDRLCALSAGFNMHVPKPVEPAELAMVIASLAGRRRAK
jgi:PAS domain S-box-containing protein